jgi:hypothetical protein
MLLPYTNSNSQLGRLGLHSKTKREASEFKCFPEKKKKSQIDLNPEMNRTNRNMTEATSESIFVSKNYHGDVFSVEDLAHLPVISSNSEIQITETIQDTKLSPISPTLCNLQTPEKRPGRDSHSSGNVSRRSWGFASNMLSPSKLIFSPNKRLLSPNIILSPKRIGEINHCCVPMTKGCVFLSFFSSQILSSIYKSTTGKSLAKLFYSVLKKTK